MEVEKLKREGGLLTLFPSKKGGKGLLEGDLFERGALKEDLRDNWLLFTYHQ